MFLSMYEVSITGTSTNLIEVHYKKLDTFTLNNSSHILRSKLYPVLDEHNEHIWKRSY